MAGWAERLRLLLLAASLWLAAGDVRGECDYAAGLQAFLSGDRQAADRQFFDCLTDQEYAAESHFHMGILARNAGNLDAAEHSLSESVRLSPKNVPYRLEWAVANEWLGRLDQARDIYADALSLDAGNLPARLGIARMDHWQGRMRRSVKGYRALLADYPGDIAVKTGLAFALMADNRLEESRSLFEQVLVVDTSNASAHEGLGMLKDIRLNHVESSGGRVRDANGRDITQYRLAYVATPRYALKWGIELVGRDTFVTPPDGSGIPVNRAVGSAQSLFAEYRFNARSSALIALRREELAGDEDQRKMQVEMMHKLADRHRVFAGVIPSWIDGERVNTLSYAGYVFESDKKWSAMAQWYYGWDSDFDSSHALSLSWTRNYGKRNWLRLGASLSDTDGARSESATIGIFHHFGRAIAASANLVSNFTNDEQEINLGVIYEF